MSEPKDFWHNNQIFVHYGIGYIVDKKTLKTRSVGDFKKWHAKNEGGKVEGGKVVPKKGSKP